MQGKIHLTPEFLAALKKMQPLPIVSSTNLYTNTSTTYSANNWIQPTTYTYYAYKKPAEVEVVDIVEPEAIEEKLELPLEDE